MSVSNLRAPLHAALVVSVVCFGPTTSAYYPGAPLVEGRGSNCPALLKHGALLGDPAVFEVASCDEGTSRNTIIMQGKFVRDGLRIPITIKVNKSSIPVRKLVFNIIGGPGGVATLLDTRWPFNRWVEGLSQACDAAVITPGYAGTRDRSNYPSASVDQALHEIGSVRQFAEKTPKTSIAIIASLGAYLWIGANGKIASPTLAVVPLLRSPNEAMKYIVNDKSIGTQQELVRNQWITYRVGPLFEKLELRSSDFIRAFFGNSPAAEISTASSLLKSPPSPYLTMITRKSDLETGDEKVALPLVKQGHNLHILSLRNHIVGPDEMEILAPKLRQFLNEHCR